MKIIQKQLIMGLSFLITILSSCTASTFSTLQENYYSLLAKKTAGESLADRPISVKTVPLSKDEMTLITGIDEVNRALVSLAKKTEIEAQKAEDQRTKIGLWRLSAMAAWQAGEMGYDETIRLSILGQQACKEILSNEFGAPRDCAILLGIGILANSERLNPQIQEIQKISIKNRGLIPQTHFQQVETLSQHLDNQWENMEGVFKKLNALKGLDQSVTQYYQKQHYRFHCNYFHFLKPTEVLEDPLDRPGSGPKLVKKITENFCKVRKALTDEWKQKTCMFRQISWNRYCTE